MRWTMFDVFSSLILAFWIIVLVGMVISMYWIYWVLTSPVVQKSLGY